MFALIASLAFAFAPATADDAAAKELAALAQKVKDAESYSFTFLPASKADDEKATPWKVEFKKKLPLHFLRGEVDFFKSDEKFVMKGKDGKWSLVDAAKRAKGQPPGAGGATGTKKADPATKGDGHEKKGAFERIAAATDSMPLPHRLFEDFAAKVTEVTKDEKDGKVVYHAKFTPAAVREFMNSRAGHAGGKDDAKHPAGGAGEGGAAGGGDGAAAKHGVEATCTLNITAKGEVIETIEIDLDVKAAAGDRKGGGTLELSKLNATNLVVPAEVQAELGGGATPEKK